MKKLFLLLFFSTGILFAQIIPFGMITNQPIQGNFSGPSIIYLGQNVQTNHSVNGGTWSSLNTSVATIDPVTGVLTGVSLGTATINYNVTQNGSIENFSKSIQVTNTLSIGIGYGGGVIAYLYQSGDPGYSSTNIPMLIAAVDDYPVNLPWYPSSSRTWNANNPCISCSDQDLILGSGEQNTISIASRLTGGTWPTNTYIFGAISSFINGGFNDWFVPSRDELYLIYIQKEEVKGFSPSSYWTSNDDLYAFSRGIVVSFTDGSFSNPLKSVNWVKTRPIRYATLTISVPDAPTNINAVSGNQQATISFEPPISNGGNTINGYTVTAVGDYDPPITGNGISSPITITGLTNGQNYTFTVKASNEIGESVPSLASNEVIPATIPDAPSNISAVASNQQATISFEPPISNGGNTINGYTVTAVGDYDPPITGNGISSPITITGLTNGQNYTFTVKASNEIGESEPSLASNQVAPAAIVPDAPTNINAVSGNQQATISFEPPISDGGNTINGYTVTAVGDYDPPITGNGISSPITITGLTNGQNYTFTVKASNAVGESVPSLASNQITPAETPGAPTEIQAVQGDDKVTISFNAPSNTGGSPIFKYTVTAVGDYDPPISKDVTSSPITLTRLTIWNEGQNFVFTEGQNYTFIVRATNNQGLGNVSAVSNEVTYARAPQYPVMKNPISGSSSANLVFWAPYSNNGSPIIRYEYRVYDSSGAIITGWISINADDLPYPNTPEKNNIINVTGLTNGVGYFFIIRAINAVGTSNYSKNSSVVTPN